ncbi:hypothetical protein BVRB_013020 [Beta vulgaris subsp. vulgaris]|uniref:Uncharacterized protein n=1 Tax=Beta vulgaris subsp. vulgaris TaxID=3555 RepID=A0A0J8B5G4_BETVV|nr:hypothetical protein BVRB_013020 [Beta vulgaris subsp. vulgaris]
MMIDQCRENWYISLSSKCFPLKPSLDNPSGIEDNEPTHSHYTCDIFPSHRGPPTCNSLHIPNKAQTLPHHTLHTLANQALSQLVPNSVSSRVDPTHLTPPPLHPLPSTFLSQTTSGRVHPPRLYPPPTPSTRLRTGRVTTRPVHQTQLGDSLESP